MIVALHVATGAIVGAAVRSRTAAGLLGIPLHLAGDRVPHRDIHNRRFEVGSGLVLVGLLALRRGITDAATIGALAACSPDVEHIIRLPRPGGSKLFHGRRGWHRSGGLSTRTQLLVAGLLVGSLLGPVNRRVGTLRVPIQRTYRLEQTSDALNDLQNQHTQGKLAITIT